VSQAVGVYIGRKQVVACVATMKKGAPEIKKIAIEPFPDESQLRSISKIPKKIKTREGYAVYKALEKMGAQGNPVTLAFSSAHGVTRYFEIPLIPEKERDPAIRYEASRYLPFKIEELVSDFKAQPKTDKPDLLSVTYTSSKKDIAQLYLDFAGQGSAKVTAIEPVFSALTRALAAAQNTVDPNASYGLIYIDSDESVNITLVYQQFVVLSHDFLLTGDVATTQARFSHEFKASFEYLYRVSGQRTVKQVYLSGTSDLEFWKDYLTRSLKGEVRFEIISVSSEKPIEPAALNTAAIAFGLALRAYKRKSPLGDFLLLPVAENAPAEAKLKNKVLIEALIFTLIFVLLGIGAHFYAGKMREKLIGKRQGVLGQNLMTKSVAELRKVRDQMKSSGKVFRSFSEENDIIRSKLLAIAKTKPQPVWIESLVYGNQLSQVSQKNQEKTDPKLRFVISGYCFLNNPQAEIQMVNKWANALSKDEAFMKGTKKIKVSEMRFGTYQGKDTTIFQITSE